MARLVEQPSFRHEALLYEGRSGFLAGALPFIREGIRAGEPVLVAVEGEKIGWLRAELGDDAGWVEFEDMRVAGRNPARLIGLWHGFVEAHGDAQALRGIGEPAHPGRGPEELDECRRHEALLNFAFADDRDFWLLCPYDTAALAAGVVEGARKTHPLVAQAAPAQPSPDYRSGRGGTLAGSLPRPPVGAAELCFTETELRDVRAFVDREARAAGVDGEPAGDLVFAAGELATNSVRHGGGGGTVRFWTEGADVVLEISDAGRIGDPLVGRVQPGADQVSGRGLWLVNQLCDLVQIRSGSQGTAVRARMTGVRSLSSVGSG